MATTSSTRTVINTMTGEVAAEGVSVQKANAVWRRVSEFGTVAEHHKSAEVRAWAITRMTAEEFWTERARRESIGANGRAREDAIGFGR